MRSSSTTRVPVAKRQIATHMTRANTGIVGVIDSALLLGDTLIADSTQQKFGHGRGPCVGERHRTTIFGFIFARESIEEPEGGALDPFRTRWGWGWSGGLRRTTVVGGWIPRDTWQAIAGNRVPDVLILLSALLGEYRHCRDSIIHVRERTERRHQELLSISVP